MYGIHSVMLPELMVGSIIKYIVQSIVCESNLCVSENESWETSKSDIRIFRRILEKSPENMCNMDVSELWMQQGNIKKSNKICILIGRPKKKSRGSAKFQLQMGVIQESHKAQSGSIHSQLRRRRFVRNWSIRC